METRTDSRRRPAGCANNKSLSWRPEQVKKISPSAGGQFDFFSGQLFPFSCWQVREPEISDAHSDQSQSRMANRRRHSPHLTVFAFNQFQTNPAIGNAFAKTDWRNAWRNFRLRLQNPRAAWQRFTALNRNSSFQFLQIFRRWNFFDLRPILALMCASRVQQLFIPLRFIA